MDWFKGKFTGKHHILTGNSMVSYRFSLTPIPLRYPSVTSAEVLLHGPQLVSGRGAAGGRGTRSLAQRPVAAAVSQVATRRPGKAWGGWWDAGYCWLGDIQRCHENPQHMVFFEYCWHMLVHFQFGWFIFGDHIVESKMDHMNIVDFQFGPFWS